MAKLPFFAMKTLAGGGTGATGGKYVGAVTDDSAQSGKPGIFVNAMPTTRLDGSALQDEDFVRVHSSATTPLVIGTYTFNTSKSVGYYYAGAWVIMDGVITETNEVIVKNKTNETLYGTANTQAQVNIEFRQRLKTYRYNQNTPSANWTISHGLGCFPSVTVVDTAGTEVIGEVTYVDEATINITFAAPFSGNAYLN